MDEKKISQERMKELLEKEAKADRYAATAKRAYTRRNARINIILAKAKAQRIDATDQEVDEYLKKK